MDCYAPMSDVSRFSEMTTGLSHDPLQPLQDAILTNRRPAGNQRFVKQI